MSISCFLYSSSSMAHRLLRSKATRFPNFWIFLNSLDGRMTRRKTLAYQGHYKYRKKQAFAHAPSVFQTRFPVFEWHRATYFSDGTTSSITLLVLWMIKRRLFLQLSPLSVHFDPIQKYMDILLLCILLL
jgi:hypothetical protein